jgi:hypothetical protein
VYYDASGNAVSRLPRELKPSSDADLTRRLVRRFESAVVDRSADTMAALRVATIAFAESMRATGQRPESAVITLKTLLRGHGGAGWSPSLVTERSSRPPQPEALVYWDLFAWWWPRTTASSTDGRSAEGAREGAALHDLHEREVRKGGARHVGEEHAR